MKTKLQSELKSNIDKIDEELKSLGDGSTPVQYKTNMNIGDTWIFPTSMSIAGVVDIQVLLKFLVRFCEWRANYEAAAKSVKLETYPVPVFSGFPVDSWIHDIELRIKLVTNSARINELKILRGQLAELMSRDTKITEALGNAAKVLEKGQKSLEIGNK